MGIVGTPEFIVACAEMQVAWGTLFVAGIGMEGAFFI